LKQAKKNPEYYVHFKKLGEVYRKIDQIAAQEPNIANIQ
jgi:hypothetical protein